MIVVVLSVTPERLRGELTRWLLEISNGVYTGHLPARVRIHLWERILEDVGHGRAIMVWSTKNEQRLQFLVHNHSWEVVDFDGLQLMRRFTPESREMAKRRRARVATHSSNASESEEQPGQAHSRDGTTSWSLAGRRRRYRNVVEQRFDSAQQQRFPSKK